MPAHSLAHHSPSMFATGAPAARLTPVPAATPAPPDDVSLVVTRSHATHRGTCALCWSGPGPLAGSVRQWGATGPRAARRICSRCLVTLEMLAVQFVPQLRLSIEMQT